MCNVYQNAFITIAAASARNSTEGCFLPRPYSIRKSFITAVEAQDTVEEVETFARPWQSNQHWIKSIGDGPWNRDQNPLETRAWAVQEHLLSQRILRFTPHELVWHCRETYLCECLPGSVKHKQVLQLLNLEFIRGKPKSWGPGFIWPEMLTPFTRRAITYESDRLEAVSGIAAMLSAASGMTYVGGMWKEMLGNSLCWQVDDPGCSRREQYYAPTWSWASVMGHVQANDLVIVNPLRLTEVVDVVYTLATPNPYGRLSDAMLIIRGILVDVHVTVFHPPENGDSFQLEIIDDSIFELDSKLTMKTRAFPDIRTTSDETPELPPGDTLSFLILAGKAYGTGFDSMAGVLLVRDSSGALNTSELTYRRVGMGECRLKHSDRNQREYPIRAENGLAWRVADGLAAKGYVSTVIIV